jgi:RNA polymerase sigma-70 factor (ECF subfamily)
VSQDVHDGRFTQALLACQDDLYAYLFSLTLNVDAAEDLLQQSNLVACKKSREAQAAPDFRAWLFKTAHLEVMAWRRKNRREHLIQLDSALDLLAEEDAGDERKGLRASALAYCLEKLSPQNRELILRRHQPGAKVQEMAVEMHRSVDVVSNMLYRIRKTLLGCIKRRLGEEGIS